MLQLLGPFRVKADTICLHHPIIDCFVKNTDMLTCHRAACQQYRHHQEQKRTALTLTEREFPEHKL